MKNVTLLLLMTLSFAGCEEDKAIVDPGPQYLPQTSPENVVHNLVESYNLRDIDGYAALIADDFQFYFDEGTRQENRDLPIFWTRFDEIELTRSLFECPDVTDISLSIGAHGTSHPANEISREDWAFIDVSDVLLEVEKRPGPGETEGTTFRAGDSQLRWYFRKGVATEDAGSEIWYFVEWRDYGPSETPGGVTGQAVEATTWAELKALCQ